MMTVKAAALLAALVSAALGFGTGWLAYGLRHRRKSGGRYDVTNRD